METGGNSRYWSHTSRQCSRKFRPIWDLQRQKKLPYISLYLWSLFSQFTTLLIISERLISLLYIPNQLTLLTVLFSC